MCLSVTNTCATRQLCDSVSVTAPVSLDVATIVIGSASGVRNSSVRVPVSIKGVENLTTLSGTFEIETDGIASVTGVGQGAIMPQFNADNNSFSYLGIASGGTDLNKDDETLLFFLNLKLGEALGSSVVRLSSGEVTFELSGVSNGLAQPLPINFTPGSVTVSPNTVGMISSRAMTVDGQVLKGVEFMLSEENAGYEVPIPVNADGSATTVAGVSLNRRYFVKPHLDDEWKPGLSTFEIFLGRRALLGLDVPQITSPYQMVAADMDCSGSFSNVDLYLMQVILLGKRAGVDDCSAWNFVPEAHVFADDWKTTGVFPAPDRAEILLAGDTLSTFVAVKRGDIMNDVTGRASEGSLDLIADLPASLAEGAETDITIRLTEATELAALQMELALPNGLRVLEVLSGDLGEVAINEAMVARNRVRLSWYDKHGLGADAGAGDVIVGLRVRAERDLSASDLLPIIQQGAFPAEAHASDLSRSIPTLRGSLSVDRSEVLSVLSLAPNPATETASLHFSPASCRGDGAVALRRAWPQRAATEPSPGGR